MIRITVTLHQDEHEALLVLAERERRNPREQAAVLIRGGLERHGLLTVKAHRHTHEHHPDAPEVRHD